MHELPGLYIYKEYLKDTIAPMGLDGGNNHLPADREKLYVFSNQKAVKELLNSGRRICFID